MSYTSTTWSPSSLQLRLALNFNSCRKPHTVFVRTRMRKLDRDVRVLCVAQNGERRNEAASKELDSEKDVFSGWSGSDDSESSTDGSEKKNWFGGFVGAGVAGIILLSGLTVAALSISRHKYSRPNQEMKPLTAEQETSLSVVEVDENTEDENEGMNINLEYENLESEKTGIDQDPSSSPEPNKGSYENKTGNDNEDPSLENVIHTSTSTDVVDSVSVQRKYESESDGSPIDPEMTSSGSSEYEILVGSSVELNLKDSDSSLSLSLPEPTSGIEDYPVTVVPNNLSNLKTLTTEDHDNFPSLNVNENSNLSLDSAYTYAPNELVTSISVNSQLVKKLDSHVVPTKDAKTSPSTDENPDLNQTLEILDENMVSYSEANLNGVGSTKNSVSGSTYLLVDDLETNGSNEMIGSQFFSESPTQGSSFSAGMPAPSVVSAALQVHSGKILVPAAVDLVQGQALAALQVLKVIEANSQPGDLCTRREYARWLVAASSALSRNSSSKVYPAMYIENVTELAFDDITPGDPDFSSIQGLAEAGLIASKLSNHDLLNNDEGPFCFFPKSPLSRQDLVTWKMALEKRQLPEADRKTVYQLSGFKDIDKISPDAWPALVADISTGEQGIIALAFGCTRLFQPEKPVTKAQAAIALATGEASDMVNEELVRIEAESIAENAVSAHNELVAQVEKEINDSFKKELSMEREKVEAIEKMAEQAKFELDRLRAEREDEHIALMKERAAIESEMEVFSKLRQELEQQMESLLSNKAEISYEKEQINKLRKEAENENQEISRLQYELEVERKALSMARGWAEDEAKRAREQAKALEEARDRWERHGIKVVVDSDLQEETTTDLTWLNAGKHSSTEGTVNRAENLVDKLKIMAENVTGKSKEVINMIVHKILLWISALKSWSSTVGIKAEELKDKSSLKVEELKEGVIFKTRDSIKEMQQRTEQLSLAVKEGARRVAGDCREGVEKLTQKFKV